MIHHGCTIMGSASCSVFSRYPIMNIPRVRHAILRPETRKRIWAISTFLTTVGDDLTCVARIHRRRSAVIPGLCWVVFRMVPQPPPTQSHLRLCPASSNWCPGFPSLAAMGNFRNGWVMIGPRRARDLEDNHILTGLSGYTITSHSPSSLEHLWRKLMPPKTQFTNHLPLWFDLRAYSKCGNLK